MARKRNNKYCTSSDEESDTQANLVPERERSTRKACKPAWYGHTGSRGAIEYKNFSASEESDHDPPQKKKKSTKSFPSSSPSRSAGDVLRTYQSEKDLNNRFEIIKESHAQMAKSGSSSRQMNDVQMDNDMSNILDYNPMSTIKPKKNEFFASNSMPTLDVGDLNQLELNLKSPEFFLTAVCIHSRR